MSFFKFGIIVTSVSRREAAVFGDKEARCSEIGREFGEKLFAKLGTIMIQMEAEWTTEDNAGGLDRCSKWYETE